MDTPELPPQAEESPVVTAVRLLEAECRSVENLEVLRELGGGYTEAQVAVIDAKAQSATGTSLDGQYVLKAAPAISGRQALAHASFAGALPEFANEHVPRLLVTCEDAEITCDIYQVAGESLSTVRNEVVAELLAASPGLPLAAFGNRLIDRLGRDEYKSFVAAHKGLAKAVETSGLGRIVSGKVEPA